MGLLLSLLTEVPTVMVGGDSSAEAVTEAAKAVSEAGTQAAQAASSGGLFSTGTMGMIVYVVALVAIFYFLAIRPSRKRDKQLKEMQAAIQVGDDVVTSSGLYGKVVEISDDVITVEFGTNRGVRIPVKKSEILGNKAPNVSSEK